MLLHACKLGTEIQNLPSQFEVNLYFAEMRNCLERISGIILDDQLPDLKESAEYIQRLIQQTKDIQGIPYVSRMRDVEQYLEGKTRELKMEIRWIPLHLVDIVLRIASATKSE